MDMEKNNTLTVPLEIQHTVDVIADFEWQVEVILGKDSDIRALDTKNIDQLERSLKNTLNWKHNTLIHDFFNDLRRRIGLLKNNTPNELFFKVFWQQATEKIIVVGTLFSIHFYLEENDYLKAYNNKNSWGFYKYFWRFGSISVTRITQVKSFADIDHFLIGHDVVGSKQSWKTTLHEVQHARYDKLNIDSKNNGVLSTWINETLAHCIDGRDIPHVKERLLWIDFFIENSPDRVELKNIYKSNDYAFWNCFYEYRRVMWNIVDFANEFVGKMQWTEGIEGLETWRQKWVDILSLTPVWKWYTLMPDAWWKARDFLMKQTFDTQKSPEDIQSQLISFEKFAQPIKVINPPKKKQWNIIVIPSYDEGYDVINAIESVADQVISQRDFTYSVMVVINNSSVASNTVKSSNQKTMNLIENLWKWTYPKGISKSLQRKMTKIMASDLQISVVDLFSDGESRPENNVGYARDVGWCVATEYLENPWDYMIQIDADTQLDPKYLEYIRKDNGSSGGQSGNVVFRYTHDVTKAKELDEVLETYRHILMRLRKLGTSKNNRVEEEWDPWVTLYSGCNIAVSKQRFLDVWGFDHISGAEDVLFSMKINTHIPEEGKWVHDTDWVSYNENLTVYPKYRPSERTERWHGHGHEVIKKLSFSETYGEFKVQSNESYIAQRNLENEIERSIVMGLGKEEFIKYIQWCSLEISKEQYEKIYEYTRWIDASFSSKIWNHHHLNRLIEDIIGQIYPKIPLENTLDILLSEMKDTYPDVAILLGNFDWKEKSLKERLDFMKKFLHFYNTILKFSPLLDFVVWAQWILEKFPVLNFLLWEDLPIISGINQYLFIGFDSAIWTLADLLEKDANTINKLLEKSLSGYDILSTAMRSKLAMAKGIESQWEHFGSYTLRLLESWKFSTILDGLSGIQFSEDELSILREWLKQWDKEIISKKYSDSDAQELERSLSTVVYLYNAVIQKIHSDKGFIDI
jgi:hypothetical protein